MAWLSCSSKHIITSTARFYTKGSEKPLSPLLQMCTCIPPDFGVRTHAFLTTSSARWIFFNHSTVRVITGETSSTSVYYTAPISASVRPLAKMPLAASRSAGVITTIWSSVTIHLSFRCFGSAAPRLYARSVSSTQRPAARRG